MPTIRKPFDNQNVDQQVINDMFGLTTQAEPQQQESEQTEAYAQETTSDANAAPEQTAVTETTEQPAAEPTPEPMPEPAPEPATTNATPSPGEPPFTPQGLLKVMKAFDDNELPDDATFTRNLQTNDQYATNVWLYLQQKVADGELDEVPGCKSLDDFKAVVMKRPMFGNGEFKTEGQAPTTIQSPAAPTPAATQPQAQIANGAVLTDGGQTTQPTAIEPGTPMSDRAKALGQRQDEALKNAKPQAAKPAPKTAVEAMQASPKNKTAGLYQYMSGKFDMKGTNANQFASIMSLQDGRRAVYDTLVKSGEQLPPFQQWNQQMVMLNPEDDTLTPEMRLINSPMYNILYRRDDDLYGMQDGQIVSHHSTFANTAAGKWAANHSIEEQNEVANIFNAFAKQISLATGAESAGHGSDTMGTNVAAPYIKKLTEFMRDQFAKNGDGMTVSQLFDNTNKFVSSLKIGGEKDETRQLQQYFFENYHQGVGSLHIEQATEMARQALGQKVTNYFESDASRGKAVAVGMGGAMSSMVAGANDAASINDLQNVCNYVLTLYGASKNPVPGVKPVPEFVEEFNKTVRQGVNTLKMRGEAVMQQQSADITKDVPEDVLVDLVKNYCNKAGKELAQEIVGTIANQYNERQEEDVRNSSWFANLIYQVGNSSNLIKGIKAGVSFGLSDLQKSTNGIYDKMVAEELGEFGTTLASIWAFAIDDALLQAGGTVGLLSYKAIENRVVNNVVGKVMRLAPNMSPATARLMAERAVANNMGMRMTQSILGSTQSLGFFDAAGSVADNILRGGVVYGEDGQPLTDKDGKKINESVWKSMWDGYTHGMMGGFMIGATNPLYAKFIGSRLAYKPTDGFLTKVGKYTRDFVGKVATEGTAFAIPDLVAMAAKGGHDTSDYLNTIWGSWKFIAAMKASHAITSAFKGKDKPSDFRMGPQGLVTNGITRPLSKDAMAELAENGYGKDIYEIAEKVLGGKDIVFKGDDLIQYDAENKEYLRGDATEGLTVPEELEGFMNDKNVSASTKNELMALITNTNGVSFAIPYATRAEMRKLEDGSVAIETYDDSGTLIKRGYFANDSKAQKAFADLNAVASANRLRFNADKHEREVSRQFGNQALREVAEEMNFSSEEFNEVVSILNGETEAQTENGRRLVNEVRKRFNQLRSQSGQTSADIFRQVEEQTGVDIQKALKKKPGKLTANEVDAISQAAEMFNELPQRMEARRKRFQDIQSAGEQARTLSQSTLENSIRLQQAEQELQEVLPEGVTIPESIMDIPALIEQHPEIEAELMEYAKASNALNGAREAMQEKFVRAYNTAVEQGKTEVDTSQKLLELDKQWNQLRQQVDDALGRGFADRFAYASSDEVMDTISQQTPENQQLLTDFYAAQAKYYNALYHEANEAADKAISDWNNANSGMESPFVTETETVSESGEITTTRTVQVGTYQDHRVIVSQPKENSDLVNIYDIQTGQVMSVSGSQVTDITPADAGEVENQIRDNAKAPALAKTQQMQAEVNAAKLADSNYKYKFGERFYIYNPDGTRSIARFEGFNTDGTANVVRIDRDETSGPVRETDVENMRLTPEEIDQLDGTAARAGYQQQREQYEQQQKASSQPAEQTPQAETQTQQSTAGNVQSTAENVQQTAEPQAPASPVNVGQPMPMTDKGEPDYLKATPAKTAEYIVKDAVEGLDITPEEARQNASEWAHEQVGKIQKELDKLQARKPKMTNPAKYRDEFQKWKDNIARLNDQLAHFQEVERIINEQPSEQTQEQPAADTTQPSAEPTMPENIPLEPESPDQPAAQQKPSLDSPELAQAQQFAENLGLPFIFTSSDSDIHKGSEESKKRSAEAYFTADGRLVLNVDNNASWDMINQKILHEGVGHYGLQRLFGEDFDTFLDNVWEAAAPELRRGISQWLGYNPQYTTDPQTGERVLNQQATRREAVNEYMSRLAEKTDFTPQERTLWNRIKDFFMQMLRRKGFNIKQLTDDDLRNILRESRQNLIREEQNRRDLTGQTTRSEVLRPQERAETPAEPTQAETPATEQIQAEVPTTEPAQAETTKAETPTAETPTPENIAAEQAKPLSEKQKQPGVDHSQLFTPEDFNVTDTTTDDTTQDAGDATKFSLTKRTRATIEGWLKKRQDISEEQRNEVLDYLDQFDDSALQLAAGKWTATGKVRLPEDMEKIQQAVEVAKKAKVDPLKYESPMQLIEAHADIQIKEKPIDPATVPTLSNPKDIGNGVVIYNVADTEESRQNMRRIINTHFGKEASPWCLLQGDENGNLTKESANYWSYYNKYPKQVAFQDGHLIAFSANDTRKRVWWDRQDNPTSGVPITIKRNDIAKGARQIVQMDPKTGEISGDGGEIFKGEQFRPDERYEEWYPNGQHKYIKLFDSTGKKITELHAWLENGTKVHEYYEGVHRKEWYNDGTPRSFAEFDEEGNKTTRRWDTNGQLDSESKFDSLDNGTLKTYREGRLLTEVIRSDDGHSEERRSYDSDGKLFSINRYKDRLLDGVQESSFTKHRSQKEIYKEGELLRKEEYKDGNLLRLYTNKEGLQIDEYYNDKGIIELRETRNVDLGGRKEELFDDEGNLKTVSYIKDNTIYRQETYNPDGSLKETLVSRNGKLVPETPQETYSTNRYSRNVGRNTGYTTRDDGTSLSNRAKDAEDEGSFTAGKFKSRYKVSGDAFDALEKLGVVEKSEWHHTGKRFKESDFFSWKDSDHIGGDTDYGAGEQAGLHARYMENKKEIDRLAADFKKRSWEYEDEEPVREMSYDQFCGDKYRRLPVLSREEYLTEDQKREKERLHAEISQNERGLSSYGRYLEHRDIDERYDGLAFENYKKAEEETLRPEYDELERENVARMERNRTRDERNARTDGKEAAAVRMLELMGYGHDDALREVKSASKIGKRQEAMERREQRRKEAEAEYEKKAAVIDGKRDKWLADYMKKGKVREVTRVPLGEAPENFVETKREMNGRYGWFESSARYNLPEYVSGYAFDSKRLADSYRKFDEQKNDAYRELVSGNSNTRYSADPFYSNAERAVQDIRQDKATAEQWLAMLRKNGGLKAGEDKWLGLSDWLNEQKGKSVTKQDILNYISQNKIRVEEVHYDETLSSPYFADPENGDFTFTDAAYDEMENRYGLTYNDEYDYQPNEYFFFESAPFETAKRVNEEAGFVNEEDFDFTDTEDREEFVHQVETNLMLDIDSWINEDPAQIPDNGNAINGTRLHYTTDGLTNKREIALTVPGIEPYNASDTIHFGDAGKGRAVAWIRFGDTTDSEGNRVLVIDEIQSKRHQDGRKLGYGENAVPDAPFDKNWQELAMKRMLRYAAENGYDKVAWTTGQQQSKRYGIGDVIDSIRTSDWSLDEGYEWDLDEPVKTVFVNGTSLADERMELVVKKDGVIVSDINGTYNGHNITELFGRDVAKKILQDGEQDINTEGLVTGDKGMKTFYDQIIPSFMDKYTKKWGTRTHDITLPEVEAAGQTMHAVDVTPEMKESVMQGQTLFSRQYTPETEDQPLSSFNPLAHATGNLQRIAEREEGRKPIDWSDPYEAFRRPRTAALELSRMTDRELLQHSRTAEGYTDDWNFFNDEYDRRHRAEYAQLTEHYTNLLDRADTSLDDAYSMLNAANQRWNYGAYATDERTELRAQRDTLDAYIADKEQQQAEAEDSSTRYSRITDQATIDRLEAEKLVPVYRSMLQIDGRLYPPMASLQEGTKQLKDYALEGWWIQADEHPENAYQRNGKWYVNITKDNGDSTPVAYNPYLHTSDMMMNDQFASAQDRPNLVVVRMLVPQSEIQNPYQADRAHKPTGWTKWNAGVIEKKIGGQRNVLLTRYGKIDKVLSPEEVARHIYDNQLRDLSSRTELPTNVFDPATRAELEKLGVRFIPTDNRGRILSGPDQGKTWTQAYYDHQSRAEAEQKARQANEELAQAGLDTQDKIETAEVSEAALEQNGLKPRRGESRTQRLQRASRIENDVNTALSNVTTEGSDGTTRYSNSAMADASGLTAFTIEKETAETIINGEKVIKEYDKRIPLTDSEGNVIYKIGDKVFNHKNPLTPDDLKTARGGDTALNLMLTHARQKKFITQEQADRIYQKMADMLNLSLNLGAAENGGVTNLTEKWQWMGEEVFRTVATNGDAQYGTSIDITRICKKNEAVINAISELQQLQQYGVTPSQIIDLYDATDKAGYQVPCPVCYVFSRYIRNGKYASAAINGMKTYGKHLINGSDPWTAKQWADEMERLDAIKESRKGLIDKANSDITLIAKQIDTLHKELRRRGVSEERKKEIREQIDQLDSRYRAALDVASQQSLTNWIKAHAIQKEGGEWTLREDAYQPEDIEDYNRHALDLRLTASVYRKYPAIQRLRKSGGAAGGKETTQASDNYLGEVALGIGRDQQEKLVNWYKIATDQSLPADERKAAASKAKRALGDSYKNAARQTLRGGQRMWSWSDNIERLAPDVALNIMQMEILKGAMQTYSKQLEGINLTASMGVYVNGSLMARDNGYREVTKEQCDYDKATDTYTLKNDITEYDPQYKRNRTYQQAGAHVWQAPDGRLYTAIFDDVIGIDPFNSTGPNGEQHKGLFWLNDNLDKAGNIIVGMNDTHILTCLADPRIFFCIPWHSSGQSVHLLNQMLEILGTDVNNFHATDYTSMQEEKDMGAPAKTKKKKGEEEEEEDTTQRNEDGTPIISETLRQLWENIRNRSNFKSGIGEIPSGEGTRLSAQQLHYRELRKAILDGTIRKNKAWLKEVQDDEFLSQVLTTIEQRVPGKKMTAGDNEFIYPYEYWDKKSVYGREPGEGETSADINGLRYLEYCRRLGRRPKFSGNWKKEGKEGFNEGNFTDAKGYWKLLIDRRMYDTKGNYQDLTPVSSEGFNADYVNPDWTAKHFKVTRVADEYATKEIVKAAVDRERQRFGDNPTTKFTDSKDQLTDALDNYKKVLSQPSTRFSLPESGDREERTLMGVHNISERKLADAIRLGGLANPSLAVIDTKNGMHTDYGEISLIPRSDLIDSRSGRNAGTWAGDAWTPTYPQVEKIMSDKGRDAYYEDVRGVSDNRELTGKLKMVWDNYLEGRDPDNLAYWFFKDQGVEPEKVFFDSGFSGEQRKRYAELTDNGRKGFGEMSDDERSGIISMMAEQEGVTVEEKLAKYRNLRERNAELLAKDDLRPYKKAMLQRTIDEIDKYGITLSPVNDFLYGMKQALKNDGKLDVDGTLKKSRDKMQADGMEEDFRHWLEEKERRYGVKEMLFDGYTRDGDRKYVPNTIENASRMMNREPEANSGGQTGFGASRAMLLEKMHTLADIRKQKGKLSGVDENTEQRYKAASDEMFEVVNALSDMQKISDNPFSNVEYANARLNEALGKKDPIGYLNKEFGYKISKGGEFSKKLKSMVETLENLPVKYFETKFRRPVQLNEFAVAVVPEKTSAEVVKALKDAGLDVRTYDGTKEGRQKVTMDAVRDRDDVRFSLPDQTQADTQADTPSLADWNPLTDIRRNIDTSRNARQQADQAWGDHRARREQAIRDAKAINNDAGIPQAAKERLKVDLLRKVADVRSLVSKVREGDRQSVQAVTKTVLDMADAVGDGLTRGAVKRIMHAIDNATTRRDVKSEVDKAVDVILTQVNREVKREKERLLKTKATKLDPNNVRVAGQLDERGQRTLKQLNELLSPEGQASDIDSLEVKLADEAQSDRQVTAGNAADKLIGVKLAKVHRDTIGETQKGIDTLKQQRRELEEELYETITDDEGNIISRRIRPQFIGSDAKPEDKARRESINQQIDAINDAIQESRVQLIRDTAAFNDQLSEVIERGKAARRTWAEEQKMREDDILHDAFTDLQDSSSNPYETISRRRERKAEGKRPTTAKERVGHWFAKSLGLPFHTFDTYLRKFGQKAPQGEGYLWQRFSKQWEDSATRLWLESKQDNATMDAKVEELFGEEYKAKHYKDIYKVCEKMDAQRRKEGREIVIDYTGPDGTQQASMEVGTGQALYILLADQQPDGRMKLRAQGITEAAVEQIRAELDPRIIQMGDWIVNDFLPKKREWYNQTYKRVFGADMKETANYFPIKIFSNARHQAVDVGAKEGADAKPSTTTGSIIERTRNTLPLDPSADAFDVLSDHIKQMNDWAAWAEMRRDLNMLNSSTAFRNKVENLPASLSLGTGKDMFEQFKTACALATGAYDPKSDAGSKFIVGMAKNITAAKIAFRVHTALKQLLSHPAFWSDARPDDLIKAFVNFKDTWDWAMQTLPILESRWKSRTMGDTRLADTGFAFSGLLKNVTDAMSKGGMLSNAFIDAYTCASGARAVYNTKMRYYENQLGLSHEDAHERAVRDATFCFNQSQQSSEGMFVSQVQRDRGFGSVMFTTFRNGPMGYERQLRNTLSDLHALASNSKADIIAFRKGQLISEFGLSEDAAQHQAEKDYGRRIRKDLARLAVFGYVVGAAWNMGGNLWYYLFGDDDEQKANSLAEDMLHGIATPIEGLAGGNWLSDLYNNTLVKKMTGGEPNISFTSFFSVPMQDDIDRVLEGLGNKDPIPAYANVLNLLAQGVFGTNLATLTDAYAAVVDAAEGYGNAESAEDIAEETLLAFTRVIQAPTGSTEGLYLDNMRDKIINPDGTVNIDQFEKWCRRYVEFKKMKDGDGFLYQIFDDAQADERYHKRIQSKIEERGNYFKTFLEEQQLRKSITQKTKKEKDEEDKETKGKKLYQEKAPKPLIEAYLKLRESKEQAELLLADRPKNLSGPEYKEQRAAYRRWNQQNRHIVEQVKAIKEVYSRVNQIVNNTTEETLADDIRSVADILNVDLK